METLIVLVVLAVLAAVIVASSVKIIPQARTANIERLGKYNRTAGAGLTLIIPFVDRMLPMVDMREQVVSFPPQPVITEDNLVVSIDTVVYFRSRTPRPRPMRSPTTSTRWSSSPPPPCATSWAA